MEIFKDHVKKITSIKTDSRPTNIFPKTKKKTYSFKKVIYYAHWHQKEGVGEAV